MAHLSFKALIVTIAIGVGAIAGVNASSAAPTTASPMIAEPGSAPLIAVDSRHGNYRPAACSSGQAVSKANRMGIRNARAVANRNSVRVTGWKRNQRTVVVFARAPGCPILR